MYINTHAYTHTAIHTHTHTHTHTHITHTCTPRQKKKSESGAGRRTVSIAACSRQGQGPEAKAGAQDEEEDGCATQCAADQGHHPHQGQAPGRVNGNGRALPYVYCPPTSAYIGTQYTSIVYALYRFCTNQWISAYTGTQLIRPISIV